MNRSLLLLLITFAVWACTASRSDTPAFLESRGDWLVDATDKEAKEEAVGEATEWLLKRYGEPVFVSKVELVISNELSGPGDGEMMITSTYPEGRLVVVHPAAQFDRQYLVHELFHARYQTRHVLYDAPRFFVEGQAAFAQYQYVCGLDSSTDVLEFIRFERDAVESRIGPMTAPFEWHMDKASSDERKLAYLKAAEIIGMLHLRGVDDMRLATEFANSSGGGKGWKKFLEFCKSFDGKAWEILGRP